MSPLKPPAVQFNTLQTLAREPATDFYSSAWVGPPGGTLNPHGNLGAMDILNAAVHVASTLAGQPDGLVPSNSPRSSGANIGAIVGGVVGGVTAMFLLAVAFVFFRRRRQRVTLAIPDLAESPIRVSPFLEQAYEDTQTPRTRKGSRFSEGYRREMNEIELGSYGPSAADPVEDGEIGSMRLVAATHNFRLDIPDTFGCLLMLILGTSFNAPPCYAVPYHGSRFFSWVPSTCPSGLRKSLSGSAFSSRLGRRRPATEVLATLEDSKVSTSRFQGQEQPSLRSGSFSRPQAEKLQTFFEHMTVRAYEDSSRRKKQSRFEV
ncbi:hypothetical protein K488DRAFT_73483 [Vararia minispora EC-137]|uniref:Uncharacterized protein n=1 Tax=Vararia minispora EC-137 TaxID=1314806 RepID=A0ACB8QAW5_9AGAM|nr:hypothetical protein K488DRAFT_73483 [Vararia minispora EC-137]